MEPAPTTTADALDRHALYSPRAVRVFSVLFSAIAGGALTAHNFKALGYAAEARKAFWASTGYTVLALVLASFLPEKVGGSWLGLVIGLAGAAGLEAYFKRFVSDWAAHPAKATGKPLLICLAIFIPLIALVIYSVQVQQP